MSSYNTEDKAASPILQGIKAEQAFLRRVLRGSCRDREESPRRDSYNHPSTLGTRFGYGDLTRWLTGRLVRLLASSRQSVLSKMHWSD